MRQHEHWEHIYRSTPASDVSWYQPEATLSLDLIRRTGTDRDAPIIDVGGGASTLVDGLLSAGYANVTVLDLAGAALAVAQQRLGERASRVKWVEGDVLTVRLAAATYSVWHDRAVFHFLTDPRDRSRYVAKVRDAVRPGGHVIVASFAADGPTRCSGLDVVRYSPETMHAEFGDRFRLVDSVREEHHTPSGSTQAFVYCLCRVRGEEPVGRVAHRSV
jgi:2-polyprenyl-3-methyl-5-hydroxy-6-metoxy-1,4-benzoquinol methylase